MGTRREKLKHSAKWIKKRIRAEKKTIKSCKGSVHERRHTMQKNSTNSTKRP